MKNFADIFRRKVIAEAEQETLEIRNVIIDDYTSTVIGDNVYLGNWVHIRPGVVIGDNSDIRDHVFLAEGCRIGRNTKVFQFANIAAYTKIGDNCFIGLHAVFSNDKKICYPIEEGNNWKMEPSVVEDNVRIGIGAVILPGIRIASGCTIGAGAVVTKSTLPNTTYVGNPAKPID